MHTSLESCLSWCIQRVRICCCVCRRNGRFTGFPVLGVKWQRMESAGLKASYALTPPRKGVLIRSIWPTSPLAAVAGPDDIIMRFDGIQVACDGTVPFRCSYLPPSHCLCIENALFCILLSWQHVPW